VLLIQLVLEGHLSDVSIYGPNTDFSSVSSASKMNSSFQLKTLDEPEIWTKFAKREVRSRPVAFQPPSAFGQVLETYR
jgi:hypothetical protein